MIGGEASRTFVREEAVARHLLSLLAGFVVVLLVLVAIPVAAMHPPARTVTVYPHAWVWTAGAADFREFAIEVAPRAAPRKPSFVEDDGGGLYIVDQLGVTGRYRSGVRWDGVSRGFVDAAPVVAAPPPRESMEETLPLGRGAWLAVRLGPSYEAGYGRTRILTAGASVPGPRIASGQFAEAVRLADGTLVARLSSGQIVVGSLPELDMSPLLPTASTRASRLLQVGDDRVLVMSEGSTATLLVDVRRSAAYAGPPLPEPDIRHAAADRDGRVFLLPSVLRTEEIGENVPTLAISVVVALGALALSAVLAWRRTLSVVAYLAGGGGAVAAALVLVAGGWFLLSTAHWSFM